MRCEMTSPGVEEYALRARSTHGVHHAIVEVNIVIGVVLGELRVVVRVHVPLVVYDDAAIGLTLGLIALVVIVVFVVAIFHRILLHWMYTVYSYTTTGGDSKTSAVTNMDGADSANFDLDHRHNVRQCHLAKRCKYPNSQRRTITTCTTRTSTTLSLYCNCGISIVFETSGP